MFKKIKSNTRGEANILLIIVVMGFTYMFIIFLTAALVMHQVNAILYTVKVDMFMLNRAAIISLNTEKQKKNIDTVSRDDYYQYFKKALQYNYNLDDNLVSGTRLIENIQILEYEYYKPGHVDSLTNEVISQGTLHTRIKVQLKPMVLESLLKNIFNIEMHQDVIIDKVL